MALLDSQSINLLLYLFGLLGLIFVLLYTAFSKEDDEEEEK